ncbi:immunoglobulin domain-containing protein, partial [Psychroflexus sp. MES1-P1E]|uniref:immunoglobulin domain-containing protein n=1 Tax=Psychroflexus sp. MES1-P1E TaxID=2058320 RepID=UPI003F90F524
MKKKYIVSLTLLFMSILSLNAQNLWGVDASIDVANAEFQNTFTETGTASNYSISNWTALSISESNGAVTPGDAFWTRNTLGYSQGAYWQDTTPINSPSQVNGVAVFDSDFMDNNGTPGAFGTGSAPAAHHGELISPRIDLTGNTDVPLAVKFYSFYRDFQISELSVSFSSDDGVTWGNAIDYTALQADLTEGFINAVLPSNSTQGIPNLTQCRIKFTFSGDYYFAIIDDISIIVSCTDPTIPSVTYSPGTICTGSNATLNISGTLNDATNWHIYTGSCGGSQIGTTAGNTFVVTPSGLSTTYYIRGEGGCVTPGSCASVTVTAIPIDDASFNYSASVYCVDDSDPTPTITGL